MLKRNLVTSLLLYESVRTTRSRARAVQPIIDRLIAVAKRSTQQVAIRHIGRVVTDRNASRKIIEVLTKRYANRSSGLTRMVPAGIRQGDGAMLVDLTLIDAVVGAAPTEQAEKAAAPKKVAKTATKKAATSKTDK
jgi:large subunit ribosomal protein L17